MKQNANNHVSEGPERPNGDLSSRRNLRPLRMLIVDDEPNVCFTLKIIFEREGYTVTTAGSAAEALKLLETEERYELVVTDLHMERENSGFDLVRAVKKLVPPPVVIVVTGYASMDNARIALDFQIDYFAMKPIEIPEFLEAVRRLAGWRVDVQLAGD